MKNENNQKLLVAILISLIAVSLLSVFERKLTDDDTWVCKNGLWVNYGNPRDPQPTSECGKQ